VVQKRGSLFLGNEMLTDVSFTPI